MKRLISIRAVVLFSAVAVLTTASRAQEVPGSGGFQFPAPAQTAGQADIWQWDSFLTFIVKRFGENLRSDLRESLAEVFLDARYELVETLRPAQPGAADPVQSLFLHTMRRISPILHEGKLTAPGLVANQFNSFATSIDGLLALGDFGFRMGIVRLTPDALRGLARIADPAAAVDPLAYTVNVDSDLRGLLGLTPSLPPPTISPEAREERMAPTRWVPDGRDIKKYLIDVRNLLKELGEETLAGASLSTEFAAVYRSIVYAAAWQESCWRQFVRKGEELVPLRSGTGDVGIMQINQYVWRGLYDVEGLAGDIAYNGRAGTEILLHYLTRYAIRKGEDKQPGGIDNLPRATYGAYNGGPRHLTRYRSPKTSPALKRVDNLFWEKYQAVSSGRELDVLRCYGF